MRSNCFLAGGAILLSLLPSGTFAHDCQIDPMLIEHPWSLAIPGPTNLGSDHLTPGITGPNAEWLMGGLTPIAAREIVHTASINGVAQTRPSDKGLEAMPDKKVGIKLAAEAMGAPRTGSGPGVAFHSGPGWQP